MIETCRTYEDANSDDVFMKYYNTPEAKAAREKAMEDADKLIRECSSSESEVRDNVKLSCLRTNENLYKDYARSIKEHPEYKKYLQFYKYKGKDFLIVPVYDTSDKCLRINTVEVGKDGENLKIMSKPYWIPDHPYTRECNVITVPLEDKTQKYGDHRVSMNKWTGEITDVDPSEYSMDEKGINGLIDMIGENHERNFQTVLSECKRMLGILFQMKVR